MFLPINVQRLLERIRYGHRKCNVEDTTTGGLFPQLLLISYSYIAWNSISLLMVVQVTLLSLSRHSSHLPTLGESCTLAHYI